MNDNTIVRIKVPAHLYESVKEQLTLNEAKKAKHHYGAGMEVIKEKKTKAPKEEKKKVEEAITGTDQDIEQLKDLYLRIKKMEQEGTDLDSAIQFAMFDVQNPEASKELSINEAIDPNLIAGILGLVLGGGPIVASIVRDYKNAKTPEEKKQVLQQAAQTVGTKMGGVNEAVDPNLIAGVLGLVLGGGTLAASIIRDYRNAKTPEEKKKVLQQAAQTVGTKMSGNMEEAKNKVK